MNIILCGFKNCGKSSVGAALALRLNYHFDDTDQLLEAYYRKENNEVLGAAEIYTKHGQDIFRKLETDVIHALTHVDNRVIALGGGSVLNGKNTEYLHKIGKIIYLRASKVLLKQRMATRTPGFIDAADVDTSFEKVYQARYPIYQNISDMIIDVDDKSVQEIVDEIILKNNIQ
jgi:shikimate kinase